MRAIDRPPDGDTPRRRLAFVIALAITVACDGGVSYAASAFALAMFSALLFASAGLRLPAIRLRVLRLSAQAIAAGLAVLVHVAVRWDPSGIDVHPIWHELGRVGGTRAIVRMQPLWELAGSLVPFVAFAAALPLVARDHGRRSWFAIAVLGAVFAFYGLLQSTLFPTWHFGERTAYVDSLTGFFVNRNVAAAFLMMTTMATLVLLDRDADHVDPRHWRRLIRGLGRLTPRDRRLMLDVGLFAIQFSALFLTKSRAGVFVGLLAVTSFVALRGYDRYGRSDRRITIRALLGTLGVIAVVVMLLAGRVALRYDLHGVDDDRWCAYPAMTDMAARAWPWGVGSGGFQSAYAPVRDAACGIAGVWDSAHDGYIQGVTTMGAAFPVVIGVLLVAVMPPLVAAARRGRRSRPGALAVLVAIAALATHSLVDFPLEVPADTILLALMIATALGSGADPGCEAGGRGEGCPPRRRSMSHARKRRRARSEPVDRGLDGTPPPPL